MSSNTDSVYREVSKMLSLVDEKLENAVPCLGAIGERTVGEQNRELVKDLVRGAKRHLKLRIPANKLLRKVMCSLLKKLKNEVKNVDNEAHPAVMQHARDWFDYIGQHRLGQWCLGE